MILWWSLLESGWWYPSTLNHTLLWQLDVFFFYFIFTDERTLSGRKKCFKLKKASVIALSWQAIDKFKKTKKFFLFFLNLKDLEQWFNFTIVHFIKDSLLLATKIYAEKVSSSKKIGGKKLFLVFSKVYFWLKTNFPRQQT